MRKTILNIWTDMPGQDSIRLKIPAIPGRDWSIELSLRFCNIKFHESDGNTDKNLTMLLFEDENGPIGQFNWFAVHPTAMNNTNTLINGDSKGWASNMLENEFKRQVSMNLSNRSANRH